MNLNIRFPREMWQKYLIGMDGGYSDFCRDAIINKIQEVFNDQYANDQIEYHNNKIKEWKEKIKEITKSKHINQDKIKECLKYWHDAFENKTFLDDKELIREIEKRILPNLKKLGYEGSSKDIAELFLNWPEE